MPPGMSEPAATVTWPGVVVRELRHVGFQAPCAFIVAVKALDNGAGPPELGAVRVPKHAR